MRNALRNLEAYLAPRNSGVRQFDQTRVFPGVIGETLDAELVAVAVGKLGEHLIALPIMPARFIFAANRRAKAQQDKHEKAAKADGKEPFGQGHAATSQKSSADTFPSVTFAIAAMVCREGHWSVRRNLLTVERLTPISAANSASLRPVCSR